MASLNSPAQLKARYPEMAVLADPVCQSALDDANEEINEAVWGARASKGEAALAAHMLVAKGALNDPNATGMQGAGPIQSMRVGDVSVSFDVNAMARAVDGHGLDMALTTTKYGLEYSRLIKSLACGGAVTGC
jgi:hypothetical protein